MSRRLAAIVAHPDDDTWGVAGTVALHADDPALRFVLVHVTSGEAGQIAEGSGATRETLGAVREEEDRRSWIALGRQPDRHEWFRLPDHRVEEEPYDDLVERIATVLREERPDVVITFGPEGITGHPDHITVGRAATEAFHLVRAEGGGGLARLLHNSLPQSWMDAWNEQLVAAGREPFDPERLYHPRGVPDATIGVVVDCSPVAARKLAALREHVTQAGEEDDLGDEEEGLEALGREAFVLAWPPRAPGAPVLGDVFEGLPG
jgi:LmbE family N-acetylglucosaminyl deacetylase